MLINVTQCRVGYIPSIGSFTHSSAQHSARSIGTRTHDAQSLAFTYDVYNFVYPVGDNGAAVFDPFCEDT